MNMSELYLDLKELGSGENIAQAALIYLYITVIGKRIGGPLFIDGPANSDKEHIVDSVMGLFPNDIREKKTRLICLEIGTSATISVAVNVSDTAIKALLSLNREKWTLEGLAAEQKRNAIRLKHMQFQEQLGCIRRVIIPYMGKIEEPKEITKLEQDIFYYLIEGIALISQGTPDKEAASYIEAKEQDFHDAKEILIKAPVLDRATALSSESLEFAKALLKHRETRIGQGKFKRADLMRAFKNKFQTFKPIGKRLEELIEAGFIEIVEKRGYKNSYGYSFSEALREANEDNLIINRYMGFRLI